MIFLLRKWRAHVLAGRLHRKTCLREHGRAA
jgi:hypothetical protein